MRSAATSKIPRARENRSEPTSRALAGIRRPKRRKKQTKPAMKLIPNFDKLKANVELTITPEGLKIELLENKKGMFFESGKPQPTEIGKEVLVALSKEIGKIPNHLLIEGHTDSTPYGSDTYSNWNLSSDRANEARKLMISNGLQAKQV